MTTRSEDLRINHSYAKESRAVGEEIEGLLVRGSLHNVSDWHNQSPSHLLILKQRRSEKKKRKKRLDSIGKSAAFDDHCSNLSEIPCFLLNFLMSFVSAVEDVSAAWITSIREHLFKLRLFPFHA